MNDRIGELLAPTRLMMTPGPCSIDPRVYRALSTPLVGHMDPWFTEMIGEVQVLLRKAFQTENRLTFPISASGSGGIEAAVVNPLEPGDEAIICVNGNFSERMAVIASRTPAKIHRVEAPLGRTVDPEDVRRAGKGRKIKFIGVCHGETSTGVISPIDDFRKVADELGTMLIVDAVATLVGTPLNVDQQRIDLCFSGSQKAISAPPGMAPITVGPRMEETLRNRKTPVQSWYFDLTTTMNSTVVGEEFELKDIPYVQYFQEGYALHAAYWHDDFGIPRSHGCINLSPADAKWLFQWTVPQLPRGWHSVRSAVSGSVVFVHS